MKIKNRPGKGEYVTYVSCMGSRPITGERVRLERTTRKALEDAIDEFYRHNSEGGDAYASLTAKEALDARTAIDFMRASGLSSSSLLDAAKALVASESSAAQTVESVGLGEALAEYEAAHGDWSLPQRIAVKDRVGRFVAFAGVDTPVSEVGQDSVTKWLSKYSEPKTHNNVLRYIQTFFRWCAEKPREWRNGSPTDAIKARPIPYREPKFLKADEFERLLRSAEATGDAEAVSVMVLGYMMGIRHAEIVRLAEGDGGTIDTEDGAVRITLPKGWTRGMVPRLVPMIGNVAEWFRRWDIADSIRGASVGMALKRTSERARSLGIVIPHNAARHTFITMYVALTNDVTKAMTVAGTGRQHVARSYMGMASRREAEAFFGMHPTNR